jgi:SAM-dependent methyltransferase
MLERSGLRRAWDAVHQSEPVPGRPDEGALAFLEGIRPRLAPDASILEAGCGRGRNASYLSRAGLHVYACDLSTVALEIAKARAQEAGLPVSLQAADLRCLPYASDFFAAAICVHVLPYHPKADLVTCLRELWRVLGPNGWLYFDLLTPEDVEYGCGEKLEGGTFLDPDGTPLHFSPRQEVDELSDGFALERVTRIESISTPARTRVSWAVWAVKRSIR